MKKYFEDGFDDHSLKKLEDDIMWNKTQKRELKNRILINVGNLESQKRMKKHPNNMLIRSKKLSPVRKLTYFASALIILFGLFIGSAFVSPAMAEVVSKIPYLNLLFEPNKSTTMSHEDLIEAGYNVTGFVYDYREKTIEISISGTKKYYNNVKGKVKQKVNSTLQSKGIDAFKIIVSHDDGSQHIEEKITEDQKKEVEEYFKKSTDLENDIMSELKKQNFGIISAHVRINKIEKFIPLEILVTEKRVEEMKRIVENIVKEKNLGEFTIKVYRIDPEKEKADSRWSPVIDTIAEGLMGKKEFKVTGVGYSFYPSPLTLSIRTSVESTDSNAMELGARIEETVREFVESNEVENNVKDDPYKINVYSKDKKKIN